MSLQTIAAPNSPSTTTSAFRALGSALMAGLSVFLAAQTVWATLLWHMLKEPSSAGWGLPVMATFLIAGASWLKWGPWPARGRDWRRTGVRLNPVPLRTILFALGAGWSTMVAGFCLYVAHRSGTGMGGENPITLPHLRGLLFYAALVMAGIVAGFVEEVAFRGFMQRPLERRFGIVPAILVSGTAWALCHTNHGYFREEAVVWLGIFLAVAAMLGTIANRTDSVVPGILVHAGFDSVYFLAAGLLQPRIAPIAFVQSLASPPSLLLISATSGLFATVCWCLFLRATAAKGQTKGMFT